MGLLLLIPGLILAIVGTGWFTGAATVGLILIIIGGSLVLFQVLFVVGVFAAISRRR